MTYSAKARELRRCRATRKDGKPCQGWACWGDSRQLCRSHGGERRQGVMRSTVRSPSGEASRDRQPRSVACRCPAYAWPHRPGGGFCRWPDPPTRRSQIPPGTRAWWKRSDAGISISRRTVRIVEVP